MPSLRSVAKVAGPAIIAALVMGAGPGKADVCHKGTPISVGLPAVVAHLLHGDSLGNCAPPPPPPCPPGDGSCQV